MRSGDVEDDHDGGFVIGNAAQLELDAHVNDGHDDSAQVDYALDEIRRVSNGRDGFVAPDLLDLEDVDPVFLAAQSEGQQLAA